MEGYCIMLMMREIMEEGGDDDERDGQKRKVQ
jgi:hypothetical protein